MDDNITTFPITGAIELSVRLGHGSLTVVGRDDLAEATVTLTPHDATSDALARCTVEMRGRTLVVTGPRQGGLADVLGGWRRDRDSVDAVIEVPTGTPVKAATASTKIDLAGVLGSADIATSASDITVERLSGDLRVRYGRATTHIGRVDGSIQVRGGGGSTTVETACGDVDIASGSGAITIGLPEGVSARTDLTSGSGHAYSDLPIGQTPTPGARSITIRVRTGSGNVRVTRAPAAA